MTRMEVIRRTFPVLVALILLVLGYCVGLLLAETYLPKPQCMSEKARYVTGGLGTFSAVISLAFSVSKAGFLHIGSLYRFVRHGDSANYRWLVDGAMLGFSAFALSGLLSFSLGTAVKKCPPPPECQSAHPFCAGSRTEDDCRLCKMHGKIQDQIQANREEINRLQLQRVGAFPLLFQNARSDGQELSHGVQPTADQFASWHNNLFGNNDRWPAAATEGIGYCVVGFSSPADFKGKPRSVSDDLNVCAAKLRADGIAERLVPFLKQYQNSPQVASCRWHSYSTMKRPRVLPDAHLELSDRHQISRSAFVHGMPLPPDTEEGGNDVGSACHKFMTQKLGVEDGDLLCSTFDVDSESHCTTQRSSTAVVSEIRSISPTGFPLAAIAVATPSKIGIE